MPAKYIKRVDEEDVFCHIFNRGIEGRLIFNDKQDFETFVAYLNEYLSPIKGFENIKKSFVVNGRTYQGIPHQPKNYYGSINLVAYHIAPDHFHLLLHQLKSGSIKMFIRSLSTRYSMYFNKKYNRNGALFEGPYKSVHVKDNHSLVLLTRYLHKHPLTINTNQNTQYSSYPEYLGTKETDWIKTEPVLSYFRASNPGKTYRSYVENKVFDPKEENLLESIALEKLPVKKEPPKENMGNNINVIYDPPMAEEETIPFLALFKFVILSSVFVILFSLGIKNVWDTDTEVNLAKSSPIPAVAGVEDVNTDPTETNNTLYSDNTTILKNESMGLINTDSETADNGDSKIMLRAKKVKEFPVIYVQEYPVLDSKVLTDLYPGDLIEYVSLDSDWYEVRLLDNSIGYIPKALMEIAGEENY